MPNSIDFLNIIDMNTNKIQNAAPATEPNDVVVFHQLQDSLNTVEGGSVFITDIQPQNPLDNVGGKVYADDGVMLQSCLVNTEELTVYVKAMSGATNYTPVITVNGITVTMVEVTPFVFTGQVNITIDFNNLEPIKVVHEDGANHEVVILTDPIPEIETAIFTGGYPGSQTELKENDTYDLRITTDIDIVEVEIQNHGACKSATHAVTGNDVTVQGVIANRGTTAQLLGYRVRVKTATGSTSPWFDSNSVGSTNGLNVVNLNNLYPSVTIGTVTYPAGQGAIKNSENATVANTVTNFNTVTYSSPNSQLSVTDASNYQTSKTVQRIAGDYNITTNNFRIVANRSANNSTTTSNGIVFIAHTSPTITISVPHARLRSGGNDGTTAQNYTVTITSNQRLFSAPSLTAPKGTWQGGSFNGSTTIWTRSLQIHDNDEKGSYNFSGLSAINLAGIEQNTINSGAGYTLGGFVSRQIPLIAFANESIINTEAIIYEKVTLSWSFNGNVSIRAALDSAPPVFESWCLVAIGFGVKPVTVRILDDSYNSSTQESTITIQEVV